MINENVRNLLLYFGVVLSPAILVGVIIFYITRKARANSDYFKTYEFSWGRIRLLGTKLDILQACGTSAILCWLYYWDVFWAPILILIALILAARKWPYRWSERSTSNATSELLDQLAMMTTQINNVRSHVQMINREVVVAQSEIDSKEQLKIALEEAITAKSKEAENWAKMTDGQRDQILDAAASVMSKQSRGTFWWGLILGLVFNLIASAIWAVMGNPGKEDIYAQIMHIERLVSPDHASNASGSKPGAELR
ncbi:hypothetical protein LMG28138_01632 [Pararobbsia alpina]|uniref:Uncharacterized protein n=2 Tax=Pararobbsia alpina TaxID=621374 RepID=A0A6S7AZU6_9BURK|nr:hypothetical protein LMG28138_01632 [Pararobbsia alpina]